MAANDNASGPPPRKLTAPGPRAPDPNPSAARRAVEEAALADGEAARRALAVETAQRLLTDPGVLDHKRLGRLGRDGVAVLVHELRRRVAGPDRPRLGPMPSEPRGPARRRGGGGTAPPTAPLDGVAGWWERPRPMRFEQRAFRRGLILGAFLVLALVYAFLVSGY